MQSSRVPQRSSHTTTNHLPLCPHTVAINLEAPVVTYDPADMWQPCRLYSEFGTWAAARAGRSHFGRLVRAACGRPPSTQHRISDEQRKPKFFNRLGKRTGSFYGCDAVYSGSNLLTFLINSLRLTSGHEMNRYFHRHENLKLFI